MIQHFIIKSYKVKRQNIFQWRFYVCLIVYESTYFISNHSIQIHGHEHKFVYVLQGLIEAGNSVPVGD